MARFKMLKTSKRLIGIHKAAERDRLICFLRIYNCKYLKYFTILIIYIKKFLDCDWLRGMQFLGNTVQKKVIECRKKVI